MKKASFILAVVIAAIVIVSGCKSKEVVHSKPKITNDKKYAFDFIRSASLDPVLERARTEGKLIFLDVYTTWCLPCRMMDEDVFTHQLTADKINENFISYKVDAEKDNGPILAYLYEVKSYPTLLFLDPDGNVLERKEGAAYHSELVTLADNAKAKYPQ